MLDDGKPLTSDEIVIDPMVPAEIRHTLAEMHRAGQRGLRRSAWQDGRPPRSGQPDLTWPPAPSAGGQLIPFGQSSPQVPQRPKPTAARAARAWGACALACLIGTLIAAVADSVGFIVVLLIATAIATTGSVRSMFDATKASETRAQARWNARYAGEYWHRRYVVPQTDLDREAKPVWERAVAAANEIRGAYVVQQHIVDSVQVAAVLPQRLWEIAEGFAGLSQARGRQREILRRGEAADQRVAARVSAQGRKMKTESRRLEASVRKLEEIAARFREADVAKRSEAVLGRLGEVDELLGDLRARSAGTASGMDPAERLGLEAQAIIDQANEAARYLALPDLGEEDDQDEGDA